MTVACRVISHVDRTGLPPIADEWGYLWCQDQPAAFMSYVRFNDRHDDGQLTQFRERLSAEVRVQTGEEFPIFQDRNDIAWGQSVAAAYRSGAGRGDPATWSSSLRVSSAVPACQGGSRALPGARASTWAAQDLILPVYYVQHPGA